MNMIESIWLNRVDCLYCVHRITTKLLDNNIVGLCQYASIQNSENTYQQNDACIAFYWPTIMKDFVPLNYRKTL